MAATSTADLIRIHYRRPPERETTFEQRLLERRADCIVTFLEETPVPEPVVVRGRVILEPRSPIVWFTFPGKWYDIGRFHLANGRYTGIYANILTPVHFADPFTWQTTDLFLDVWLDAAGGVSVLDVDELEEADAAGWLDAHTIARARAEAVELVQLAERRAWPPHIVWEWTLDRALDT